MVESCESGIREKDDKGFSPHAPSSSCTSKVRSLASVDRAQTVISIQTSRKSSQHIQKVPSCSSALWPTAACVSRLTRTSRRAHACVRVRFDGGSDVNQDLRGGLGGTRAQRDLLELDSTPWRVARMRTITVDCHGAHEKSTRGRAVVELLLGHVDQRTDFLQAVHCMAFANIAVLVFSCPNIFAVKLTETYSIIRKARKETLVVTIKCPAFYPQPMQQYCTTSRTTGSRPCEKCREMYPLWMANNPRCACSDGQELSTRAISTSG